MGVSLLSSRKEYKGIDAVTETGAISLKGGLSSAYGISEGVHPIIEYKGESVTFNLPLMPEDVPYPFAFLGHNLCVVKRSDNTLDIYHLP